MKWQASQNEMVSFLRLSVLTCILFDSAAAFSLGFVTTPNHSSSGFRDSRSKVGEIKMQASGGEPRPFADTFFQRQDLTARSKIDVSKARLETRGCKWPGAGDVPIHFNNAGAALMPSAVVDAYVGYIKQEEEMGGYEVAAQRFEDTERFYSAAAKLLNCNSDEIAFVESATRGWHLAFYSLPLKAGDRVITSAMDYGSNFVAYLQAKQRFDIEIVIVPGMSAYAESAAKNDEEGQLDLAVLKKELAHSRARVLSISHIPTGGGVVNPAEEIGRLAKYQLPSAYARYCGDVRY